MKYISGLVLLFILPLQANPYQVDFNISMGMLDPYFKKYMKHFKSPNRLATYMGVHTETIAARVKENYTKNKIQIVPSTNNRIPRIFHQIWIGRKPFPRKI